MLWLLCLGFAALVQGQAPAAGSLDVSTLTIGAPATIAAIDAGAVKGDFAELSWSSDGSQIYLQTVAGNGKANHYLVDVQGGTVKPIDTRPAWAADYWKFKSDRYAPGVESLVIDVQSKYEQVKYGTGSAGALDRTSGGLTGFNDKGASADNVDKAALHTTQHVVKLTLLGETIGTWVDQRVTPGTTFSWGPSGSGAIAFVDERGQLVLLDTHSHKQPIAGTKDVSLPAWSLDGSRLAYLSKAGRNKYMLTWSAITRK